MFALRSLGLCSNFCSLLNLYSVDAVSLTCLPDPCRRACGSWLWSPKLEELVTTTSSGAIEETLHRLGRRTRSRANTGSRGQSLSRPQSIVRQRT